MQTLSQHNKQLYISSLLNAIYIISRLCSLKLVDRSLRLPCVCAHTLPNFFILPLAMDLLLLTSKHSLMLTFVPFPSQVWRWAKSCSDLRSIILENTSIFLFELV